jgi:hypothetical protein
MKPKLKKRFHTPQPPQIHRSAKDYNRKRLQDALKKETTDETKKSKDKDDLP